MIDNSQLSIDLQPLEGFYRVALERSYARAARGFRYPITQPGVHQQVRKLETELRLRLFTRVGHDELELTSAGRALFEFCAPFFERLPGVVRSITGGTHGGVLRIEAGSLEIRHLVPGWLKRLERVRPDIEVDLRESEVPEPERLLRGKVDLLVEYLPSVPPGIATRRIGAHRGFLVCPSDWLPARAPRALRSWLGAVEGRAFVGYSATLPHRSMQQAVLSRLKVGHGRTLTASSTEAILGFVAAGLGFSLVPWPNERGPSVASVSARRLGGPGSAYPVSVAWRESMETDPLIAAAIAALP